MSTLLLKNEEADANPTGESDLGEINLFSTKQKIDNEIEVLKSNSLDAASLFRIVLKSHLSC